MARMMALCSLPRTNPGNRHQYKRVNGPYKLIMIAGGDNKLPFGNFPRLILAWVSTEAVRTQSRVIVLGPSLAKFMKTLGIYSSGGGRDQIRLRNQMRRLFGCTVQLTYKDANVERFVNSPIARAANIGGIHNGPTSLHCGDSKIELSEKFFNEIIRNPVPLDMNVLTSLKRCSLALISTYGSPTGPLRFMLRCGFPGGSCTASWSGSKQRSHSRCRPKLPPPHLARVEEDQDSLAGVELHDRSGRVGPLALDTDHHATQSRPASELISPFPASQWPVSGLLAPSGL